MKPRRLWLGLVGSAALAAATASASAGLLLLAGAASVLAVADDLEKRSVTGPG